MCIRHGYESTRGQNPNKQIRPKTNILRDWYTGTYTEIANTKQGHVGKNRFGTVIAEFSPKFETVKPLARELRSALFPIRDGDIFTGTFLDHDVMYDGMIKAFNGAIDLLGEE